MPISYDETNRRRISIDDEKVNEVTIDGELAWQLTTLVYDSSGHYTWTVPEGITSVLVKVWGAGGGDGAAYSNGNGLVVTQTDNGENGGYTEGILPVTPGETLHLYVGGAGSDGSATSSNATGGSGGYSGGFAGGTGSAGDVTGATAAAGGGGGASGIRRGGTNLADTIAGAGGGGGGSAAASSENGLNTQYVASGASGRGGGSGEDGEDETLDETGETAGGGEGGADTGLSSWNGQDGHHDENSGAVGVSGGGGAGIEDGGRGGSAIANTEDYAVVGGSGGGNGKTGPLSPVHTFNRGGNSADGYIEIIYLSA